MNSELQHVDVAIVGAGMVGLTVACALGNSGLSVALIDPRPAAERYPHLAAQLDAPFDSRVSALTPASENILRGLGAWEWMARLRVSPYRAMEVWDGDGTSRIRFDAAELHRRHLGHIVENRVTLAALGRVLAQQANVRFLGDTQVRGVSPSQRDSRGRGYRELTLDGGQTLAARLLVVADGARSRTRGLAGLTVSAWDYEHDAIVTTLEMTQPHQATAWQCFTDDGPLALLPLPQLADGKVRVSLVWSTSPAHARQLLALDSGAFCGAVTRASEGRLGAVVQCDERHSFTLTQRHAPRYVAEGVALVGDAAHSIHPLAGQGVNLGLLDAATLAEVILDAHRRGTDFASAGWLRRYQRRRQGDNLAMIGLMGGFKHLYGDVPPPLQWLRNWGLRRVAAQLPLRQLIAGCATGLKGSLPQLAREPQEANVQLS